MSFVARPVRWPALVRCRLAQAAEVAREAVEERGGRCVGVEEAVRDEEFGAGGPCG
jgi:hypothetical protein